MYTVLRDFIFWQVRIEILDFTFVFAQTFTALFDDQFRSLNDDMNGKNVAEEDMWQKKVSDTFKFCTDVLLHGRP